MKITLLALAALVPALAYAEDPKPYVVYNGRGAGPGASAPAAAAAPASGGSGSAAGQYLTAATQASAFGANTVRPSATAGDPGAAAAAALAAAGAGQSFRGTARSTNKRGVPRAAARRAQDSPPPNYSKPGALIRTEGQLPVYANPGNAGTHSVEGGSFVNIDPRRAKDVGRAPGISWGAPDTPPSGNPASGSGSAGGNGVTANGPAITENDGHGGDKGGDKDGRNGNGNGKGNGSSISGFDPAF